MATRMAGGKKLKALACPRPGIDHLLDDVRATLAGAEASALMRLFRGYCD